MFQVLSFMALKTRIQSDVKDALKAGNGDVVQVLRMTLSTIEAKEKEKRYKEKLDENAELTDEEMISVLSGEVKKRKDAIALYEKGGRPELAEKEKEEIIILQKYLPEQLSLEEIKKLVEESVAKTKAENIKDMGKVMTDLSPKIKGKADGGEVSRIVKESLIR